MTVRDYIRCMVLAASGMGGITEHLERAINASADVETIANGQKPQRRRYNGSAF